MCSPKLCQAAILFLVSFTVFLQASIVSTYISQKQQNLAEAEKNTDAFERIMDKEDKYPVTEEGSRSDADSFELQNKASLDRNPISGRSTSSAELFTDSPTLQNAADSNVVSAQPSRFDEDTSSSSPSRNNQGLPSLLSKQSSSGDDNSKLRDNKGEEDEGAGEEKDREYAQPTQENPKRCKTCEKLSESEEQVKMLRMEMFKQLLKEQLRLDPQDSSVSVTEAGGDNSEHSSGGFSDGFVQLSKLPPSVLEPIQQEKDYQDESGHFYAEDLEVIIPGEDTGGACINRDTTGCFSFDLKGKINGGVSEAQLWVYKMQDQNDTSGQIFTVYEIYKNQRGYMMPRSLAVRNDTSITQDWITMNVTESVRRWVEERKETELLALACETCGTTNYTSLFGLQEGYKPLLVVKYAPGQAKRDKRSDSSCDTEHECCKREMVVNFRDLQEFQIIYPETLSVGYCYGSCSRPDLYTTNLTAIIQAMRGRSPVWYERLKPCCVPVSSLSGRSVLRNGGGASIIQTILHDVIVNECGCA